MRANAHYVEQLDSDSFSSPIRFIDASSIDVRGEAATPSDPFVESIRRHGVLQPLLVQGREGRYRLIAGRKRLAAAQAAGLREVPCLVQRVSEREASLLAAATNVPSSEPPPSEAAPVAEAGRVDAAALRGLVQSVSALASSASLLSSGTGLSGSVALDLVHAESARALQLVSAIRVLRDDVAIVRAVTAARTIVDRALQNTAAERRLRGVEVTVREDDRALAVTGDEELLTSALGALVLATGTLLEPARSRPVTLSIGAESDGLIGFRVTQHAVQLSARRLAAVLEPDGLDGPDADTMGVLLQTARLITEAHGGRVSASAAGGGTTLALAVPQAPRLS